MQWYWEPSEYFFLSINLQRTQLKSRGLVNSSHLRDKFRWKLNLEMTRQFSPLTKITLKKTFLFHFERKQFLLNSSGQATDTSIKGTGRLWPPGKELKRRAGQCQLFQGRAYCNCPSVANLWQNSLKTVLLYNTSLQHLNFFSYFVITKVMKDKIGISCPVYYSGKPTSREKVGLTHDHELTHGNEASYL